ncbi:MAG: hypothetical protein HC848_09805, partial [Limnobacter sp.]|nr:hypothetical protein [Limnobacter sp.]
RAVPVCGHALSQSCARADPRRCHACDATLALELQVPLAEPEQSKVVGELQLANNRLELVPAMPEVSQLTGQIAFSEQGLQLKGLAGLGLGEAVEITGGTQANGKLLIQAKGHARAPELAAYLGPLPAHFLSGKTPFEVLVEGSTGTRPSIQVNSSLQGLGINLPHPFNKLADRPLNLLVRRSAKGTDDQWTVRLADTTPLLEVRAVYAPQGQGALRYLNAGLGAPVPSATQGTNLMVVLNELNFDLWRNVFKQWPGNPAAIAEQTASAQVAMKPTGLFGQFGQSGKVPGGLARLTVVTDELTLASKKFQQVSVLAKTVEDRWQVNCKAQGTDGYFSWVEDPARPNGSLLGRFKQLSIPDTLDDELKDMVDEPASSIPALDIQADSFVLGNKHLGQLRLLAENATAGEKATALLNGKAQEWTLRELHLETRTSP